MQTTKHLIPNWLSVAALSGLAATLADAATLDGFVSDERSGAALEGALVRVLDLDLETSSNRRGYFEFDGLEPGTYAVQVRYVGAETRSVEAVVTDAEPSLLDIGMKSSAYELEDFTVNSYQSASQRAANLQRSSENLKDIVASDLFGQFADTNAAEALNRLPGVSVERDQGEGRFVVIRGIDPNLNSVALDGISLASPDDGQRSTLLDTIPIEVLSTLEVTKAVTPDQPGDAIGGFINLRSPSAFDHDGRTGLVSGAILYSDLVDETGHRVNAFYADTFGENNQWGFVLTAVDSERTFGSDNVEADPWVEEAGSFVAEEIQYREYDLVRTRTGVTANLEYQPDNDSLFFIRASYNSYEDTETRDRTNTAFEGNYSSVTARSFTNDEIETEIEYKDRTEEQIITVVSLGGEQTFNEWSVDYILAFSEAEQDTPFDREAVFYAADPTDLDEAGTSRGSVSSASGYHPRLGVSVNNGNANYVDYTLPASYQLDGVTTDPTLVTETDLSAAVNFKRDFDGDKLQYVKFGGLYRNKQKDNDIESFDVDPVDDTLANFLNNGARNFLDRSIPALHRRFLADGNLDFTTLSRNVQDSVEEDYETTEDVLAAYFMGSFEIDDWDFIVGARVEHTDFETDGFSYDEGTDTFTETSFQNDYTNFLPGIHVRRDLGDTGVFRASWTNTFARPTFEQSAPRITRDGNDVERGNPDLDPYEAMNFDVSYQLYSEEYGIFGVAVFYKDIENFIYQQEFTEGADTVVSFRNGNTGEILGLELSYSKQLIFLPGVLSGLSVSSNLTITDSEADAERESDGPVTTSFLKQSDVIGNLSLAWEWDRYFLRLSGTFRDEYLDALGDDASGIEDRYVDDFFQVDFYGSANIYEGLNVFVEVNNLFDEPFRAFYDGSGRLSQFEEYGVSGSIGAKWKF